MAAVVAVATPMDVPSPSLAADRPYSSSSSPLSGSVETRWASSAWIHSSGSMGTYRPPPLDSRCVCVMVRGWDEEKEVEEEVEEEVEVEREGEEEEEEEKED